MKRMDSEISLKTLSEKILRSLKAGPRLSCYDLVKTEIPQLQEEKEDKPTTVEVPRPLALAKGEHKWRRRKGKGKG